MAKSQSPNNTHSHLAVQSTWLSSIDLNLGPVHPRTGMGEPMDGTGECPLKSPASICSLGGTGWKAEGSQPPKQLPLPTASHPVSLEDELKKKTPQTFKKCVLILPSKTGCVPVQTKSHPAPPPGVPRSLLLLVPQPCSGAASAPLAAWQGGGEREMNRAS